ncbi:hypothetical protein HMPREF9554_01890 [Treponema phagedenis F0421]|nr:hypothetical protein HMPREF9554_01890 [Treponema phagedenis F0421]
MPFLGAEFLNSACFYWILQIRQVFNAVLLQIRQIYNGILLQI